MSEIPINYPQLKDDLRALAGKDFNKLECLVGAMMDVLDEQPVVKPGRNKTLELYLHSGGSLYRIVSRDSALWMYSRYGWLEGYFSDDIPDDRIRETFKAINLPTH